MFCNSIGTELDYREHFRKLFDLNEDTSLYAVADLAEKKCMAETRSQSILGGLISTLASPLFLGVAPDPQEKILTKALKATVRQWREQLDDFLEDARHDLGKITRLKETITPLIISMKVDLLAEKIEEGGIENSTLAKEIELLKKLMQRTVTASEPDISHLLHPYPRMYNIFSPRLTSLYCERDALLFSKIVDTHIEGEKKKREIHCSIKKLCSHTHDTGEGWIESLVDSFRQMTDETAIKSLGNTITALQVLQILRHIINNREHENKLPLLLGGLPFDKFGEVLLSLENGELIALNRIFKGSTEETRAWLEEKITEHRDPFVDTCNHLKEQIDTLCHDFRKDTRGAFINENDINDIYTLCGEVELRSEQINKLSILYEDVIGHPETAHLLGNGLQKEYLNLRIRLSSKKEYPDRPSGAVWGILYRNVFERCELEDKNETINIFGDWSICSAEEYRHIGLLGNIGDAEFQALKESSSVFIRAKENLVKLGIPTVAELKANNLFNRRMFSNYLDRREVQAILNRRD